MPLGNFCARGAHAQPLRQGGDRDACLVVDQARQRDESGRAGDGGHHELVEVVGDRPRDVFAQRPVVALVGLAHCVEVLRALVLEHDGGG